MYKIWLGGCKDISRRCSQTAAHQDATVQNESPKRVAKARFHPDLRELSNDGRYHCKSCNKAASCGNRDRNGKLWRKETDDGIVIKNATSGSSSIGLEEKWLPLEKKYLRRETF